MATTAGEFKVDQAGQATYQVPVFLPVGRGGFKPSLALNYSSGNALSSVGVGWTVSGTSVIARCRKTLETDGPGLHPAIGFDANDAFCLDGQRLVEVTPTVSSGGVREFRTEIDGFSKIVAHPEGDQPGWWAVWGKDGSYSEYGRHHATTHSRLFRNRLQGGSRVNTGEVFAWALDAIQDPARNLARFQYSPPSADGEQYLVRIDYGDNTDGALLGHVSRVDFTYSASTPQVRFVSGSKTQIAKRLDEIRVSSNNIILRRYALGYLPASSTSGRPLLTSVKECASLNDAHCLPPTVFTWSHPSTSIDYQNGLVEGTVQVPSNMQPVPGRPGVCNRQLDAIQLMKFGDADGDGRLDMFFIETMATPEIRFAANQSVPGSGSSFYFNKAECTDRTSLPPIPSERGRAWHLYDLNGDGIDDIIYAWVAGNQRRWQVSLGAANGEYGVDHTLFSFSDDNYDLMLADINSDGYVDILRPASAGARSGASRHMEIRYGQRNVPTPLSPLPIRFGAPKVIQFFGASKVCGGGTSPSIIDLQFPDNDYRIHDAHDFTGDGRSGVRLKARYSCDGVSRGGDDQLAYDYVPDEGEDDPGRSLGGDDVILPTDWTRWMIFTDQGQGTSPDTQRFDMYAVLPDLSEDPSSVRFGDINGDGMADVVYRPSQASGAWAYRLNNGQFFESAVTIGCVTGCAGWNKYVQLIDFDGDGDLDFLPISTSNQYLVHRWNGSGFDAAPQATGLPVNGSNDGSHIAPAFADLDGDGLLDYVAIRGLDYTIYRRTARWQPRDLITLIENGTGAKTLIEYAPMTQGDVYERDFNAAYLGDYGRGSGLIDVSGGQYLVRYVWGSAPTRAEPDAQTTHVIDLSYPGRKRYPGMSGIQYSYRGAKAQTGGRGHLGFRQMTSLDLQSKIMVRTTYEQAYPLTGTPKLTQTWVINGALPHDLCQRTGPDSSSCVRRAPVCGTWAANACDPEPANAHLLSRIEDTLYWSWTDHAGTSGAQVNPVTLAPAVRYFPYLKLSRKHQYDLAGSALTFYQAEEHGPDGWPAYDTWGNLLRSRALRRDGQMNEVQRVDIVNTYQAADPANWRLGRLSRSVTTTSRPGLGAQTRTSAFDYDPATGMLSAEHVEPDGTANEKFSTYYRRDRFGNITTKASCSGGISESTCVTAPATLQDFRSDDPYPVRRHGRVDYDYTGRYVDRTVGAFLNTTGTGVVVRDLSRVLQRDAFGNPLRESNLHNVETQRRYTIFGSRQRSEWNQTGASATTTYRWCGSGALCPSGAKFRVETQPSGGARTLVYHDVLGREVLRLARTANPAPNDYSAVRTFYDKLGRVAEISEPYFVTNPDAQVPGNGQYFTQTTYDALSRPIEVRHPDHRADRPVITGVAYDGLVTTTVNPLNQIKTERRNALGELIAVTDNQGFSLCYRHDVFGNLVELADSTNQCASRSVLSSIGYDRLGRKTSMTDADMGNWSYHYNAAGELVDQINARGQCTREWRDGQGRLWQRADYTNGNCASGQQHRGWFQYDVSHPGLLGAEVTYDAGVVESVRRSHAYDSWGRPSATTFTMGNYSFRHRFTYDEYGRPFQRMYLDERQAGQLGLNTGLGNAGIIEVGTRNGYDANGYLVQVRDAKPGSSGEVYWQLASQTARGRASETWLAVNTAEGGGVTGPSMRVYDTHEPETGRLTERRVINEVTGARVQHWTWVWDRLGNLSQRKDELDHWTERFFYDAVNRLDYSDYGAGGAVRDYDYAANGNLIFKPEVGALTYGTFEPFCAGVAGAVQPGPHAATKAGAVSHCYNAEGQRIRSSDQRELKYSVAGQVTDMIEGGTKSIIQYGADRQRYQSTEYPNEAGGGSPMEQVIHLGDVEYLKTSNETRRYLPGGLVISHRSTGTGARRWVLMDHQGSADRIVNRFGMEWERMGFEPFGWRRDRNGTSLSRPQARVYASQTTRRGYTGHEHYDKRALIHMNGRVYDPQIGRFVSADPFVQFGDETQSANRYSYVFNNPLAWTDPSGYLGYREERWLRTAVAVVVAVYGGYQAGLAIQAGSTATAMGWVTVSGFASGAVGTGTFKGGVQGALTSLAFFGVGQGLGAAGDDVHWTLEAAAHGVTGGVIAELQGGKFGHGFLSSGLNKAVHSRFPTDMNPYLGGAISATVGGTVSELTGGKFANGAVTAAMAYAFNEQLSYVRTKDGQMTVRSPGQDYPGMDGAFYALPGVDLMACSVDGCRWGGWSLAVLGVTPVGGKAGDVVESIWTATKRSSSAQNAFRHFKDHGADFGAANAIDYVRRAQQFLRSPPQGTLTRVRPSNGDVVRYNPSTNTFGVMDSSGVPRTFFKPDPKVHGYPTNMDYFNAQ